MAKYINKCEATIPPYNFLAKTVTSCALSQTEDLEKQPEIMPETTISNEIFYKKLFIPFLAV